MKHRLSFHSPTSIQPDNPLFVFLPGMDGTGKLYQRQAHYLTKWFDIRCLVIPPDDLSHWELLTEQVICLIERELRRKSVSSVYLCGESFGGCLGLKVALATPSWLDKLILVNPASCFNQRPWLGWGIPFTQVMPDFLYSTSTFGLLPFLASLGRIKERDRRDLLNAMQSVPSSTVSWRLSLLQDFALDHSQLSSLTPMVLLIASAGDRLLPSVEEGKRLVKSLPNAKLVVLPESGHTCLLESDVKLAKMLHH